MTVWSFYSKSTKRSRELFKKNICFFGEWIFFRSFAPVILNFRFQSQSIFIFSHTLREESENEQAQEVFIFYLQKHFHLAEELKLDWSSLVCASSFQAGSDILIMWWWCMTTIVCFELAFCRVLLGRFGAGIARSVANSTTVFLAKKFPQFYLMGEDFVLPGWLHLHIATHIFLAPSLYLSHPSRCSDYNRWKERILELLQQLDEGRQAGRWLNFDEDDHEGSRNNMKFSLSLVRDIINFLFVPFIQAYKRVGAGLKWQLWTNKRELTWLTISSGALHAFRFIFTRTW